MIFSVCPGASFATGRIIKGSPERYLSSFWYFLLSLLAVLRKANTELQLQKEETDNKAKELALQKDNLQQSYTLPEKRISTRG